MKDKYAIFEESHPFAYVPSVKTRKNNEHNQKQLIGSGYNFAAVAYQRVVHKKGILR